MKETDAAKPLGLEGEIDPEMVTKAYRRAAMQYHPDRNPAGEQMMKAINAAGDPTLMPYRLRKSKSSVFASFPTSPSL